MALDRSSVDVLGKDLKYLFVMIGVFFPHATYAFEDCRGTIDDRWELIPSLVWADDFTATTADNQRTEFDDESSFAITAYTRGTGYGLTDDCKWVAQFELALILSEDLESGESGSRTAAANIGFYYSLLDAKSLLRHRQVFPYHPDAPVYKAFGINLIPSYTSNGDTKLDFENIRNPSFSQVSDHRSAMDVEAFFTHRVPFIHKKPTITRFDIDIFPPISELDYQVGVVRRIIEGEDDDWFASFSFEYENIRKPGGNYSNLVDLSFGLGLDSEYGFNEDELLNTVTLFSRKGLGDWELEPFIEYRSSTDTMSSRRRIGVNATRRIEIKIW